MSEEWKCPECATSVPEKRRRGPHLSGCRRKAKAKYIYDDQRDPQHKHPLEWSSCKGCDERSLMRVGHAGYCSISCSQRGDRNSVWSADGAGYLALHQRIYVTLGKAAERRCMCGERARDWANLTGDYADSYDYTAMCRRCHKRYDNARRSMEE